MTKQEIIHKYQQLTGRELIELPDDKVQYIESRKSGKVKVKRDFSEIERYVILKSQPNTSINKNVKKIPHKNLNTCINPHLSQAVKSIFVPRPHREEYKSVACSVKMSDFQKLQKIAKQQNTTIGAIMKRLVELVLETGGQ
jgi:hypothetical protein